MECPVCNNTQLVMTERKSIEIDYCPNCRGVWLDRGKLDKLIEKSVENSPAHILEKAVEACEEHWLKHYKG